MDLERDNYTLDLLFYLFDLLLKVAKTPWPLLN